MSGTIRLSPDDNEFDVEFVDGFNSTRTRLQVHGMSWHRDVIQTSPDGMYIENHLGSEYLILNCRKLEQKPI